MANLVATTKLNMYDFVTHADLTAFFDAADPIVTTATEYQVKDASTGEVMTFTGSFTYGVDTIDGTITGITYEPGNTTFGGFAITDASISVADFRSYIPTNDVGGLFQQVFQGDDTLTGSAQNDILMGFAGNDHLSGGSGNDFLISGLGADTMTGGSGSDTFTGNAAGLNGDTLVDFSIGDHILITDATLAGFTFSLTGHTLTYTGGSLTLTASVHGTIYAAAGATGGVQLSILPHIIHNDFNGDGHSDILWRNSSGFVTQWLGTSTGGFSDNTVHAGNGSANTGWQIAGTGDFNGDGRSDILWRNSTSGQVVDWLSNADGSSAAAATTALNGSAGTSWHVAAVADFNADGVSDILWRNGSGYLTEWLGAGDGTFTDNSANASSGAADTSWNVVSTGDFNGDGSEDILWRNTSGYLTEWLGKSNGGFTDNGANAASGAADTSWTVVGTGDFNGDGKADLLWRNTSGYVTEWLGTSTGGFTDNAVHAATGAADNGWQIVSIADFNGDGKDDLLWRNSGGYTTEWLGTSTGGFTDNGANAASGAADSTWHVQDPLL